RLAEWGELVTRKAAGEPVQYITGEQWFYGLPFKVTPAVLIPRPETELLVEAVLAAADRLWPGAAGPEPGPGLPAPTVVDIGTGSGAIAVTLAAQRPGWRVCASDLSEEALTVARLNAARHGVSARMAFAHGDLLEPYAAPPADEDGDQAADGAAWQQSEAPGLRIDVLVSNPPYIPVADIDGLQLEVRDHEPRLALDGGEDGLAPYRRMLAQVPRLAAPPAIVAFELGQGQAQAVARMLREAGHWDEIRIIKDYAGIERHVLGART
ncbi:SAM-dependent methyltransferase, partial [Paenibacillus darwinianus]